MQKYRKKHIDTFFIVSSAAPCAKLDECAILTMMDETSISLYLHIPFCRHRCSYCDFNTTTGLEALIPAYVEALCQEIKLVGRAAETRLPAPVHTIFFGGGTPSLLPPEAIAKILGAVRRSFAVLPGVEISLEANPGTVSFDGLQRLRAAGVNRLSFGMQSADPQELVFLERQHDIYDVLRAIEWSRKAGFTNLNLDLIFGLPDQSLERWQRTMEIACSLNPEHFSLYALTVEEGTPLFGWVQRGLTTAPDDDLAAEIYEWTSDFLERAGFEQYEISNWARENDDGELLVCRHNLQYWRSLPYLGFGAAAHGYADGMRTANVTGVGTYIERCMRAQTVEFPAGPALDSLTPLTSQTEMEEMMMVGLRLTREGVQAAGFLKRFGLSLQDAFPAQIHKLIFSGLLEWQGEQKTALRLTKRGRLLGNRVFREFVGGK
ncbi:MAG: radical SAM family heme chaperone HemW [Anaerolineaceae bacterium]|nr:radical SAM family heme chaperone HemW [Anaerolineaceae bacterium]